MEIDEYNIDSVNCYERFNGDYSQLRVSLTLKRKPAYHLMNTFLQTELLLFIGYLSAFFKLDNFTDKIMVTLTTLLVVVTLTSSIQAVRRVFKKSSEQILGLF